MAAALGRPIRDLRMLEIGPGQDLERARYFSLHNEVVGMDMDVVSQGGGLGRYWQMRRVNGMGRMLKTMGRQLLLGRATSAAWTKAIGTSERPEPRLVQGDICRSAQERNSFDVVMSWSVFEHLSDPQKALRNVIHALRPGGLFYISLHLYTSNSGHHDIRAFTGSEDALPLWGHLRVATRHLITPSSYLNEWRLTQWRELFFTAASGVEEVLECYEHKERYGARMTAALRQELGDYTDEELYTVDATYLWRKPHAG